MFDDHRANRVKAQTFAFHSRATESDGWLTNLITYISTSDEFEFITQNPAQFTYARRSRNVLLRVHSENKSQILQHPKVIAEALAKFCNCWNEQRLTRAPFGFFPGRERSGKTRKTRGAQVLLRKDDLHPRHMDTCQAYLVDGFVVELLGRQKPSDLDDVALRERPGQFDGVLGRLGERRGVADAPLRSVGVPERVVAVVFPSLPHLRSGYEVHALDADGELGIDQAVERAAALDAAAGVL